MAGFRIGILSDTHDNKWAIQAISERFEAAAVEHVIHGGDYVSPFNAKHLSAWSGRFDGVFGNNDGERIGLSKFFSDIGPIHVGPHPVRLGGRRLLVMHEPAALGALGRSGDFDAVVYGHTHAVDLRTVPHASGTGETLIVNPGEGGGWVHDRATAVILDLETMSYELLDVPTYPGEKK